MADKSLFFSRTGYTSAFFISSFLLWINYAIFYENQKYYTFAIILVIILLVLFTGARDYISHITIYDNSIKIYYPFKNKTIIIPFTKIVRIAYKDSFGSNYQNNIKVDYIDDNEKEKTDFLKLNPSSFDEVVLLKHFKSKNINLLIQTKNVKIKTALNI